MKSTHTVSAVVPIYNERQAVPGVFDEIDRFLASRFRDYEIIVVESGSTDGTGEACDALPARLPHVRVHHEGARNGFGSAVRAGLSLASQEWIWPLVVDMPFSLDVVEAAMPYMDDCGCVLSFRSSDPRGAFRRVQSAVFNALGRRLLRIHVRHINSAFKIVRTSVMRSLELTSSGWLLDAELIMGLEAAHVKYAEIPVALVPRREGTSSVGLAASARTALELFALAGRRRKAGRR